MRDGFIIWFHVNHQLRLVHLHPEAAFVILNTKRKAKRHKHPEMGHKGSLLIWAIFSAFLCRRDLTWRIISHDAMRDLKCCPWSWIHLSDLNLEVQHLLNCARFEINIWAPGFMRLDGGTAWIPLGNTGLAHQRLNLCKLTFQWSPFLPDTRLFLSWNISLSQKKRPHAQWDYLNRDQMKNKLSLEE